MSLRSEVRMPAPVGEKRFQIKDIESLPHGLWVPFSVTAQDFARDKFPPFASDICRVGQNIFSSITERVAVRGSTPVYALLGLAGVQRRGTISMAVNTYFARDIEAIKDAPIAGILSDLAQQTDFDLFLPDIEAADFGKVNQKILNEIRSKMAAPEFVQRVVDAEKPEENTEEIATTRLMTSFNSRNNKNGVGTKLVTVNLEEGTVQGIPYGEAIVQTRDAVRRKSRKPVLVVGWTPGILSSLRGVQDTRRDPQYALSWDAGVTGEAIRFLPDEVKKPISQAVEMRQKTDDPREARLLHNNGCYPPASFANLESDTYFHFPIESLRVLTRPIELGSKFEELPITQQLLLSLRAVQKGSMAEENLSLSNDGREALASGSKAPAIGHTSLEVMKRVSVEKFHEEMASLSDSERASINRDIKRYMMTGLFYPQKFIEYCREADLFRFFPNLSQISEEQWAEVLNDLTPHQEYVKTQYEATHFWETGKKVGELHTIGDPNVILHEVIGKNKIAAFQNPYKQLIEVLRKTGLKDEQENYLLTLQSLLDLNPQHKMEIDYLPTVFQEKKVANFTPLPRDIAEEKQKKYKRLRNLSEKVRLGALPLLPLGILDIVYFYSQNNDLATGIGILAAATGAHVPFILGFISSYLEVKQAEMKKHITAFEAASNESLASENKTKVLLG